LEDVLVKLTCKQPDLAKGLAIVGHAVSSRSTLPILSHILLAADEDSIRLSATNLEIGITCRVPAQVAEPGTTTAPAKLLTELVNSLQPGTIDLTLLPGAQSLKVSDKRSQATLRGMDPAEFPTIPSAEGTETPVLLDAAELSAMIAQTTFAAATDDARPIFTGVLARVADGQLIFAAADSFRLAVRRAALPEGGTPGDVLIPARTLTELARILPDEGSVRMVVTPNRNQVLFHTDGVDLVSNLIAGQFPNFDTIVPKGQAATRATLPTADFRQAARQASLFARDSSNIVRLQVTPGEGDGLQPGIVTLKATAEDLGDTVTELPASVDGKGLEIIFNVKYLTDVLAVLDTPDVALELNSPQHPGVVKPVGGSGEYTYVIMPMHSTR
jgi:DNA polymerase III subunit beta